MEPTTEHALDRRIESLTVNLLECYEELDLIYRLSRGLKSTLEIQASARLVLREAMEIFEADMGCMLPEDPAAPVFEELLERTTANGAGCLRDAAVGELIRLGKSHLFYSVPHELSLAGEEIPESLLCAVMKTENSIYGALCVGRRGHGRVFTARDLKLANVLASQAAHAIEHAILGRKWRDREQALIRMAEEMRLAREIQFNLLPAAAPEIPGYDIACRGVPAQAVGGDYYDFIPLDGGGLALCLADVSGKGMPAALLMANLQATIRSQALARIGPAECARRSNRLLHRSTADGRFATCFYGVLDPPSGRLTYSNAGHDHPIVLGPGGERSALATGGLVLGVFDDQTYEEAHLSLEPGTALVAYSDGITEALDEADQQFGIERLERVLSAHRRSPSDRIVKEVLEAVAAHAAGRPQSDDMTLVVVRRL